MSEMISVRVKPGAKVEKVVSEDSGTYTVYVHARAHDGEANKAVVEILAKYFRAPKTSIRLVRGEKGRDKVFEI